MNTDIFFFLFLLVESCFDMIPQTSFINWSHKKSPLGEGLVLKLFLSWWPIVQTGGNTMAQQILCEVSSCVHWAGENHCGATEIYVVNHDKSKATESAETDCKTFEVR
jgi:hypothetical protein